MKKHSSIMNIFNRDRKILYIILSIVMISVLTITVVYAALSTTLKINGNAEVSAANWDIHFNNIQINHGSVAATKIPTIVDSKTIDFSVNLKEPGDYYKFTADIVNDGTIDAMIDSVIKTPELTEAQAKYLKYEIEYTDGNSISSKQLLLKKATRTISVLIKYRSDVASSDIPTTGENLNLSFTMIYTQSDETGTQIPINTPLVRIVNGDLNTIGSEVAIKDEYFYIIKSNSTTVTLFSKYNLYVGNECSSSTNCISYGEKATGIQDSSMSGYPQTLPYKGTTPFSSSSQKGTNYSDYKGSIIEGYVNEYKSYLNNLGVTIIEARLINKSELEELGCVAGENCLSSPYTWIYSRSYWTASEYNPSYIFCVNSAGVFDTAPYHVAYGAGVRPVITISKSEF